MHECMFIETHIRRSSVARPIWTIRTSARMVIVSNYEGCIEDEVVPHIRHRCSNEGILTDTGYLVRSRVPKFLITRNDEGVPF